MVVCSEVCILQDPSATNLLAATLLLAAVAALRVPAASDVLASMRHLVEGSALLLSVGFIESSGGIYSQDSGWGK